MLRETSRRLGSSTTPALSTPASPTRTRSSASALVRAPMSIHRSVIFEAFSRSSALMRWIAFLPTTPATGPARPSKRTRCPTRTWGSQPPIAANERKPSSSTWTIIRPISSRCPVSITRGVPPAFTVA